MKSTVVQYNSWNTGASIEWTGKKSYSKWRREREGDGSAEGPLAIGDRGPSATSLIPDADGTGSGSLLGSILPTLLIQQARNIGVVALYFSHHRWYSSTGLHYEQLLQPLWTSLHSGPISQKLTVPPQIKKRPLPSGAFQVAHVVKNLPANAGVLRDAGLIPGSGRSPGTGHGKPLQYSCLENPIDREAWPTTAHRVAQSQTWLKWLNTHTPCHFLHREPFQFLSYLFFLLSLFILSLGL